MALSRSEGDANKSASVEENEKGTEAKQEVAVSCSKFPSEKILDDCFNSLVTH